MKTRLFIAAALTLTMASCSQNGDNAPVDLKDTPIRVNASVSSMVAQKASKAGYEGNTSLPTQFYLTIDATGTDYDYKSLMKYESNSWVSYDATGSTAQTMYWADNSTAVTVKAATFDITGTAASVDLGVKADQSTEDNLKASDHLMMALTNNSVTPNETGISVTLDHMMAKILFTLNLADEFKAGTAEPNGISFAGTKLNGTLSLTDATWTVKDGEVATAITPLKTAWTAPTADAKGSATYEAIVVPQTVAANGFVVKFNVGDRSFEWTYDKEITFAKGGRYALTLTAGNNSVSGASFSSAAFGDTTTGSITAK